MTADSQKRLDLDQIFAALEQSLVLIDNVERRADIQRYIELGRVPLQRAVFDLLSEVVTAVNDAGGDVRARLVYESGTLNLLVESATADRAEAKQETVFSGDDEVAKVTIRLPGELKDIIDRAADVQGLSANSWYVRELGRIARRTRDQMRTSLDHVQRDLRRTEQDLRHTERENRRANRARRSNLKGFVGGDQA